MLKWALPLSTWNDLRRVIQEQEDAEQTETEGRRVPKEEGILEVDAKISLERERILEQETLIRKMNANPWFLYDQGVTRLKWPSGVYVVSEYGDGRVKTTSWFEVPHKLKSSLHDMGPETWILPSLFRILRLLLPEGPRAREVAGQPADGDGKGAGLHSLGQFGQSKNRLQVGLW